MSLLIEVKNLSIYHGQTCLLEPVSFTLSAATPLTILGETGAGKSILLQAIMGMLPENLSQKGEVHIFGQNHAVAERRTLWGKEMVLLPQEPWRALDPLMPAFEQVSLVHEKVRGLVGQEAFDHALADLEKVGLKQSAAKRVGQLSGGMAQRLSVSCALAGGAQILLADEPTKGLDVSRRNEVVTLLQRMTQAGGLITITHDIEVAEKLGGELIVLREGKVVEQGVMADILAKPDSDYTELLIQSSPEHWQAYPKQSQFKRAVLEAKNLSIGRENPLASGINFKIHQGEVMGVVGDSGCGKSTLGDTLLGLLPKIDGEITQLAEDAKAYQWQKLFQDPPSGLASSVPLQVLLDDLIKLHKLDASKVMPLMKRLKLAPELLAKTSNQVSGGQLQRFAILRALMLEPVFLFADEPTSRLDPLVAKEITELLVELAKEKGCALFIVSHDPALIEKCCDNVIHL